MSGLRLVTLDVTNTILKLSRSAGHQYSEVASIYGINANAGDINSCFKYHYQRYSMKYPNFGCAMGISSYKWWTDLVKDCFRSVAKTHLHSQVLPQTNQDEILTQVANHLYLHFSSAKAWEVLPGAEGLLASLKDKGIVVGAISNFDGRLEKILSCLALRHYFDFILASAKVGYEKPDGRIFNQALFLSKTSAQEAVHVGDSYENDVVGATNVGMTAYLVNNGTDNIPEHLDPKFVVKDLSELAACLNINTASETLLV